MTGYTREKAAELAFDVDDARLDPLKSAAAAQHIIAVAGAPVRINGALHIGSFILFPDHSRSLYVKRFLHPGEELHFSSSFDHDPLIRAGGERISLAICADIDRPDHASQASDRRSSVYAASIFFTPGGTAEAHDRMRACASTHSMDILISNYCGPVWNIDSGGRSAYWSRHGELVGALQADEPGLLLVEKGAGRLVLRSSPVLSDTLIVDSRTRAVDCRGMGRRLAARAGTCSPVTAAAAPCRCSCDAHSSIDYRPQTLQRIPAATGTIPGVTIKTTIPVGRSLPLFQSLTPHRPESRALNSLLNHTRVGTKSMLRRTTRTAVWYPSNPIIACPYIPTAAASPESLIRIHFIHESINIKPATANPTPCTKNLSHRSILSSIAFARLRGPMGLSSSFPTPSNQHPGPINTLAPASIATVTPNITLPVPQYHANAVLMSSPNPSSIVPIPNRSR